MLDVSFPLLAKVLGSEDDPLESIAVPHLLAIAYAVGWSGKMLSVVNPTDFAGQLEAAIEARGDIQDIGPAADTNLATAQGVATTQVQLDAVDLYVSMYGTIDSFAGQVAALPEVDDGHLGCSSFQRLAKLAVRSGKVPEGKVRSLAGRFRVELPPSTDLTEAAKAKWIWGLAQLSQCIAVQATGWLKLATTPPPLPPSNGPPAHRIVAETEPPRSGEHATAHNLPHSAVAAATAYPVRCPPPPRIHAARSARATMDPDLTHRHDRVLGQGPRPPMPPAQALPPAAATNLPLHSKPSIPASQHRTAPRAPPPGAIKALWPWLRRPPPQPRSHPARYPGTHNLITQRGGDQDMHREAPADTVATATTRYDGKPPQGNATRLKSARASTLPVDDDGRARERRTSLPVPGPRAPTPADATALPMDTIPCAPASPTPDRPQEPPARTMPSLSVPRPTLRLPGTPARTPTHAPTPPAHRPAHPIASSANRHAPAALTTLSTILGAAALAGWPPLGTGAEPPGPSHHTARYVTAGSVAAASLLRATMARADRRTAAPPPPPELHAAGTTDAAPVAPARPPTPGALPYDASPNADLHTDPATSGNTEPTARGHPAPTTDTRVHTVADDPPAPCQGRPGDNSNNAPVSEPQSRGTRGPSTQPTSARACAAGALAALVAAATTLTLALDTRPHAAHRHDAPRRAIRRTATGSLALAGTLLIATMTRRAMGACASPTPAPGGDARRTPSDTDGTPIDLSGDAPRDDPPDHDNGSDPPPTEPPLEGVAECLKDAIMKDLWYGVLELGLSAPDALRRAETNARALIDSNRALARWAHPVMLHITRELGNPLLPGWFQLTCYRDKRDTLLSYGATRQVATARARQASEQISDRQLFREHDPRALAPAG